MTEYCEFISIPKHQWSEFVEESGRRSDRLDRALALLREIEKRRDVFPGPCQFCGKLPAYPVSHGPGHADDCALRALLEESDD